MAHDDPVVARLIERFVELEAEARRRLDALEGWARDPHLPFDAAAQRVQVQVDRQAIIAGVLAAIRSDPQLQELLRGPQGRHGLDGDPGPPGDNAATVIREVKISG